ncbi:chaperonin 10-like protein [Phialemonium atrogriseum]|uniref:Chaperonin 10-like protein n=1 Tax=Phialemonium atrogriseum TaxID=1093897 RepID=A0AAJ0BUU8_9PEZI|nr:chaperonin 10-like protein [Phialemonium atrogriseum]KAK1763462.1 chaperonin 10-like protein [Phialemonium atrogriseum]
MQAVRVAEYNKPYILTTIPVPSDLGPHDLLVKVATASYCHTDSMVSSGVFSTALPCTASHEGAGTVVSVGASATSLFRPGDRVVCGLPLHACGSCADCLGPEQRRHYCRRTAGHVGVLVDGCLAEYVRVDARWTTPLPGGVSMVAGAPLACAGRTVWRAVVATGLGEGEWLAIVGSGGGLGHLGVRFAKARGLRVVGIDARDEALALSRECGADGVVDARMGAEAVAERVRELVGEGEDGGAHAAIVLADTDDAAALACAVTRMHGTVIQVAQPDVVKIPFRELIFRDIRVHGSVLCSAQDSRDMVEFVAEHGIEPKTVVFHGLESIFDLLKVVHGGKIQGKAVIIVDQDQIDQERKLGEKH